MKLCHALGHEIKKSKLARIAAVLVDEAAGEVTAEDGAEVFVRDLWIEGQVSGVLLRGDAGSVWWLWRLSLYFRVLRRVGPQNSETQL